MNKKKFPRAVTQTAEQMREAGAGAPAASAAPDNVIDMLPKLDPANVASQSEPAPADPAAALRRRKAITIVERYANYSSIGGAIPVPFANAAAIAALMIRMVKSLSQLYGVPFNRSRTRVVVIALMGGALPTGFSTIVMSTISFIPGLNLFGLAVSSVTSGVYARCIGQLYIALFENGSAVHLRSAILG